ncbi:PH domain-containing protein [Sneathiella sp. CAU 1612]|uniref:PH domain-containing protein n=1 Tax=Sneathiella sedimenti TaxID=2816034 RepID=A0ABS3F2T3_9PROT|nr:PH domain-containing protein [Sneathiella sedimenti]MBO0332826.1 PH domain-containing protein [Sneathiella sedimenti]
MTPAEPTRSPAEIWFGDHVLWPDETLLWSGRPSVFRSLFFNFWFCLCGAFLTALLVMLVWTSEEFGDVRLPEVALAFGSLWLFSSPLRYGWRAYRTAYFVTDKRVVILRKGLFRVHERAFQTSEITNFELKRLTGKRGDIRLRLSEATAPNPYQDDKEKYVPGLTSNVVAWSGSGPFIQYDDGLWGIDDVSIAAAAIRNLT